MQTHKPVPDRLLGLAADEYNDMWTIGSEAGGSARCCANSLSSSPGVIVFPAKNQTSAQQPFSRGIADSQNPLR